MISKKDIKKSIDNCLQWIDKEMFSYNNASWGIYERIRINLNQRVPYCRPDCNSEYIRVLQCYKKLFGEGRALIEKNIKKWLLSVQYKDEKKFNYGAYPFYLIDGFVLPVEGDVIWPNDNGKVMINLVDSYLSSGESEYLDSAKSLADFWLKLQNEDGTYGLTIEKMKENGVNMPLARFGVCFVSWLMLGFYKVYYVTQDKRYYDSATKALHYIQCTIKDGRVPASYELEKNEDWRPVSSDNVIALYCLANAYQLTHDEKILYSINEIGDFVLNLQHSSGAICNCNYKCNNTSLNNEMTIADLVYTEGFALRALYSCYSVLNDEKYLDAGKRLCEFLVNIQCKYENPLWNGGWRGSYDVINKRWAGRCNQNNEIDEGGMFCIYTGWTCTNIMLGLMDFYNFF